jgi:hypothetical protein
MTCGFFMSASRADNPSSTEQSETVDLAKSHTYSFEFRLRTEDNTPAVLKKLFGPFRVVDLHVRTANELTTTYVVRIFDLGDRKELRRRIFREDLPTSARERWDVRHLLHRLDDLPDNAK